MSGNKSLSEKCKKVKMVLFDVDGVLSDGRIIYGNSKEEMKCFHVADGFGFFLLRKAGLKTGIITGRKSDIVNIRGEELHIDDVFQGISDKVEILSFLMDKYGFEEEEFAFIGDDWNDYPLLNMVGVSATVRNGRKELRERVDYVSELCGGYGAARDFIELILTHQGQLERLFKEYVASR
jgi:3-deoxy-D-manno-octulosonate 8-phosphate phosphatase (KDO 8-P phosphatase)